MTSEQKLVEVISRFDQVRNWIGSDKSFLELLLDHPELIQQLAAAIDEIEYIYNVLHIADGTTRSHAIEDE